MNRFKIECSQCKIELTVPTELLGEKFSCYQCNQPLDLPAVAPATLMAEVNSSTPAQPSLHPPPVAPKRGNRRWVVPLILVVCLLVSPCFMVPMLAMADWIGRQVLPNGHVTVPAEPGPAETRP